MSKLSHCPHGTEHPYRYDLDQRVPPRPVAGEPFEIRVLADASVDGVDVVFDDGRRLALSRVAPEELVTDHGAPPAPAVAADGHLAAASSADPGTGGRTVWVCEVLAQADTSYVVSGGGETLGPFPVRPGSWTAGGGRLSLVDDQGTIAVTEVGWLVDTDGARRVRFALPLREGEHVVGFGERFDALDQRGERLDAVVFEQYKAPGPPDLPADAVRARGRRTAAGDSTCETPGAAGTTSGHPRRTDFGCRSEVAPDDPTGRCGSSTARRPTIVRDFVASRVARPRSCPSGCSGSGPAATSGTRRPGCSAEVEQQPRRGHPGRRRRHRGVERRGDVHEFRDAEYSLHADGSPAPAGRLQFPPTAPGPTPKGWSTSCTRPGVKVVLWQIPLDPDRPRRGRAGRAPTHRRWSRAATRSVRPTASPYRNRGWWFPGALLPDFTNPAAATGGRPSGATWSTRWASTGSRPTAASTRGVTTCATPTARRGDEGEQPVPRALRGSATTTQAGARDLQPGRLHRLRRPRRALGRRRGLDLGRVPRVDHGGHHRRRRAGSSSGAGTWPASPARCRTPSSTCARPRRPAFCRSCSTTRSSTTTACPAGTARRGTSPSGPATPGC